MPSLLPPLLDITMLDFVDAYVVGFSALFFYGVKTYFEAQAFWKQFG